MKRIPSFVAGLATVLVLALGALTAAPAQAATKLNPFRPLDGMYYAAQAGGTALNWSHIDNTAYFGVINEYDFEGSGAARWYTFLVHLEFNNPIDFAGSSNPLSYDSCDETCGTISDFARPYDSSNPGFLYSTETSVIAHATAELVESVRQAAGQPVESHPTGVQVSVVFYSTSVVDVTYSGKTSRFRAIPAVAEFGSQDGLTQAAYDFRASKHWVPNESYGSIIIGPSGHPVEDTHAGDEAEGFIDHLAAKWREVPDDMGWTKDDTRGAKFYLFDGYPMPPVVPVTAKEPGSDLFNYIEFVLPGATEYGYNDNRSTLGVFWDPELDRGFAYDVSIVTPFDKVECSRLRGIVLRTQDGFRIIDPYSYEDGMALFNDDDPRTNPNGRYQFYELTRY
ncbi:MAG: hypothetical protein KDI75_01155 [Xanthomonadales bacterium]|nr:hypothetical protein [Xanthomonadales bacterium]